MDEEPMLGEIRMFAGNYAPAQWALCDGSLLPIDRNSELFWLLGTQFGGDGQTTFALPKLDPVPTTGAGAAPILSIICTDGARPEQPPTG